jgi:hypothetical protein
MVWTCSDNEQREKLKETFEHENAKRERPKSKWE